jgi:sulfite reductase (ferredoxin)
VTLVAEDDERRVESAVEQIKRESEGLRGQLEVDLDGPGPAVSAPSQQLLKFHGVYAQDDRDQRRALASEGRELAHIFMARVAIPGGELTSEQWLALDDIALNVADGSIRLTTRQAVQFHGVLKTSLRELTRSLHARTMTTFGACGDVVRNTVMCPDLVLGAEHAGATLAREIASSFKPRTTSHLEIFVDGERASLVDEHEFYGDTYLPRKFKIAIASAEENCVDVLAQDLGFVPVVHPEHGPGYSAFVGGGLGRSYAQSDTFARLAEPLAFVTAKEVMDFIALVVRTYRDRGDRTNRRRARLKYVVADMGIGAFRREIEASWPSELMAAVPVPFAAADDHLGWRERGGSFELGVRVGAGRVRDGDRNRLRSALATLAGTFEVGFVITPQQDIVISRIDPAWRDEVGQILADHGVTTLADLAPLERQALACPALPTCGQALAESERVLHTVVAGLQVVANAAGVGRRPLQLRMTGCPNGCARPAVAEIGIVGRTKSTYDVYVGGGPRGDRLARLYREKVRLDEVDATLAPLIESWGRDAMAGETFGDFVTRRNLA